MKSLDLPVDVIGTSDGWGVEKLSPAFFARVIEKADCAAGPVLYVRDRLDSGIRPEQHAGISTALVHRGPWGFILEDETVGSRCLFRLFCACGAFTDRTGRWVGRNRRRRTSNPAGLRREPDTPQSVR